MKKLLFALVAVLTAATASAAEGGAKIGVGTAIDPAGTARITVPINVAPTLRIEPFVALTRSKVTDSAPAPDVVTKDGDFELGVAALYLVEVGQNVELIAGGKVDVAFISHKVTGGPSDSWNRFGIAAVGGAEYYFSPRFALGVEAELGLTTEEEGTVRTTHIGTASFVTAKVFFK